MHEYAVALKLIAAAVEVAETASAERVAAIKVRIGPDEHIAPEALALAMQIGAQTTIAQGAEITVAWSESGGVALESIDVADSSD